METFLEGGSRAEQWWSCCPGPSVLGLHAGLGRSGRASRGLEALAPGRLRGGQVAFALPKRAAIADLAKARRGPGWGPDPRANLALGLSYKI